MNTTILAMVGNAGSRVKIGVTWKEPKKPDLQVTSIYVGAYSNPREASFYVGQTVRITCFVLNKGQTETGSSHLALYLEKKINSTNGYPITVNYVGRLSAGTGGSSETFYYTFKSTDVGQKYLVFYVDYQNEVDEGKNEKNNIKSFGPFTVLDRPPEISVSPKNIDYGNINIGSSKDKTFTVTNSGGQTLIGNASTSSPFSIISGGSYKLGKNQSQKVIVRFMPEYAQNYSKQISFTGGDGTTANVKGTGIAPEPKAKITQIAVEKQKVNPGEPVLLTVKLKNIGNGNASIGGLSISFPDFSKPNQYSIGGSYASIQGTVIEQNDYTNFTDLKAYGSGTQIYDINKETLTAQYLLIEGTKNNWKPNEEHTLMLVITSKITGEFRIRIRGWMQTKKNNDLSVNPDKSMSGTVKDQQGYYANERKISINNVLPDLIVSSIDAPVNLYPGVTYEMQYSIGNNGTLDAPISYSEVRISRDQNFEHGKLIAHTNVASIATNKKWRTPKINFTIPNTYAGDCYLLVKADASNQVNELNELNNIGQKLVHIITPLAINTTEPSTNITVAQGNNIKIKWVGTGKEGSNVLIKYDKDNIWNNGNETTITNFQSLTGNYVWNTSNISPGTYHIVCVANDANRIEYSYAPGTVTIAPNYQLTLTLYRISSTDGTPNTNNPGTEQKSFIPGETVRVTMQAKNTGEAISTQCTLKIVGNNDKAFYDSHSLNKDVSLGSINKNEARYYSFDWKIPDNWKTFGSFGIVASLRDPTNFSEVYETTCQGANTNFENCDGIIKNTLPIINGIHYNVPHYYQGQTGWCAYNSVSMILKYYGIDRKPWIIAHDKLFFSSISEGPANWLLPSIWDPHVKDIKTYIQQQMPRSIVTEKMFYTFTPIFDSQKIKQYILNKIQSGPIWMGAFKTRHSSVIVGASNDYIWINDPSSMWFNSGGDLINVKRSWDDFFSTISTISPAGNCYFISIENTPNASSTIPGTISILSYANFTIDNQKAFENSPTVKFFNTKGDKFHELLLQFDGTKDNNNQYGYRYVPSSIDDKGELIPLENYYNKNKVVGYSAGLDDIIDINSHYCLSNAGVKKTFSLSIDLVALNDNGVPLDSSPIWLLQSKKDTLKANQFKEYYLTYNKNLNLVRLARILDPDKDGLQNNVYGRYQVNFYLNYKNKKIDSASFQFFVINKKYPWLESKTPNKSYVLAIGKNNPIPFSVTNYGNIGEDIPVLDFSLKGDDNTYIQYHVYETDKNYNKLGGPLQKKGVNLTQLTPIQENKTRYFVIEVTPNHVSSIHANSFKIISTIDPTEYTDLSKTKFGIINKFKCQIKYNSHLKLWSNNISLFDIDFTSNHTISSIQYQINSNDDSDPSKWHNLTTDGINEITQFSGKSFTNNWMISKKDWNNLPLNSQTRGWHYIYFKVIDAAGNVFITPDQSKAFKFGKDTYAPECYVSYPSDNQALNTSDVTVKWHASDDIEGLAMSGIKNIYYKIDNAKKFTQINPDVSSRSFTNLIEGDHTIYLYAVDNAGNRSKTFQSHFTINTKINPPKPFNLIYPGNGLTLKGLNPYFEWESTTDPDGGNITYELWYADNPLFNNKTVVKGITQNHFTPPNPLKDNTVVYWKVKAIDNTGNVRWSNQIDWSFTLNTQNDHPQLFDLTAPQNKEKLNTFTPYFNWSNSSDVDPGDKIIYHLWVGTDADFNQGTYKKYITSKSEYSISSPLQGNTKYYWKVKAVDKEGAETWSQQTNWHFITPNNAPTLAWPATSGFDNDGVNPNSGIPTSTYEFRVTYKDKDGDAPQKGYPKLHVLVGSNEIKNSPFNMKEFDNKPFTAGRTFTYSLTNLPSSNYYTYYFEAKDINNSMATGAPTAETIGPTVNAAAGYTLSGKLTYSDDRHTPLGNIPIYISDKNNQLVANSTTDATGDYSFTGLSNGNYKVFPKIDLPWKGVTAMDVTLYKKYIGHIISLSDLKALSGDVNGNSQTTVTDMTLIMQRIGQKRTSFSVGDWLNDKQEVSINGESSTQNLQAICYGDANGSYFSNNTKSTGAESFNPAFQPGTTEIRLPKTGFVRIPFILNRAVSKLSSVTLKMNYPSTLFKVKSIKMAAHNNDLYYNEKNGVIYLVYSTLQPLTLQKGDTLFTVQFSIRKDAEFKNTGNYLPTFSGIGEFGDFNDNVLHGIKLNYSKINANSVKQYIEDHEVTLYPNPASQQITITHVGHSQIAVYDMYGKCLLKATPDRDQLKISLKQFSPGTYILRVNKGNQFVYKKFIVLSH